MTEGALKFEIESKTVAEFRKLHREHDLILRPEYQRKLVWPDSAKVSLMETILLGFPIPEIYLAYDTTADGDQTASVVDGQQRLTALLQFVDNAYPLAGLEDEGLQKKYDDRYFRDLPEGVRREFFSYRFPIRRLSNLSDDFVRSVFARVNRVNMVLTEQELRNAMMPGPFNDFLKDCASHELSTVSGVFSPQRRQRGGDLEFFAESFGSCIFGLSNKKAELDERYDVLSADFDSYTESSREYLDLLDLLVSGVKWEGRTRWSNIVDMFSLLHACWEVKATLLRDDNPTDDLKTFLDDFQKAVASFKKEGLEGPQYEEARNRLAASLNKSEAQIDDAVSNYTSGVRNSSDLGSRRVRNTSLLNLLRAHLSASTDDR